ncbi:hypothetical protein EDB81DRAFT_389776 [Dactylonectria macrodidyma]|uniref:Secreted protein n=1 Tax=Dactylonectria macrodidyma TaxID=307937 RepID=A0A9P9FAG2_9HYPO|nr:hypothetical protein EDB81DRAFT_389776 [Dactylonectria macrodidyma]
MSLSLVCCAGLVITTSQFRQASKACVVAVKSTKTPLVDLEIFLAGPDSIPGRGARGITGNGGETVPHRECAVNLENDLRC